MNIKQTYTLRPGNATASFATPQTFFGASLRATVVNSHQIIAGGQLYSVQHSIGTPLGQLLLLSQGELMRLYALHQIGRIPLGKEQHSLKTLLQKAPYHPAQNRRTKLQIAEHSLPLDPEVPAFANTEAVLWVSLSSDNSDVILYQPSYISDAKRENDGSIDPHPTASSSKGAIMVSEAPYHASQRLQHALATLLNTPHDPKTLLTLPAITQLMEPKRLAQWLTLFNCDHPGAHSPLATLLRLLLGQQISSASRHYRQHGTETNSKRLQAVTNIFQALQGYQLSSSASRLLLFLPSLMGEQLTVSHLTITCDQGGGLITARQVYIELILTLDSGPLLLKLCKTEQRLQLSITGEQQALLTKAKELGPVLTQRLARFGLTLEPIATELASVVQPEDNNE